MGMATKIIVVDDETQICQNVGKILSKNKYEVVHALSAQEALDKMEDGSFSLMISDIVMPEMNGLQLLEKVKKQWPQTKSLMMTAYASTETAVKAIQMGALDYIPKPFTPDELRDKVGQALRGELVEFAPVSAEKKSGVKKEVDIIDVDMPFDADEVERQAGADYVNTLGSSDMPIVQTPAPEVQEHFCQSGEMVCDIYKKLGGTCKAGMKAAGCPQKRAKKKKGAAKARVFDAKKLIGIDMPFNYQETILTTGPEYVANLRHDGVSFLSYEELKRKVGLMKEKGRIDVDVPFDADEVEKYTGAQYVKSLGPSDMPMAEAPAPEVQEHFCQVGEMVCDIYKKLGGTCKAGMKAAGCPQKRAKKKKGAAKARVFDAKKLIGIDMPFDYEEVTAVTGPEYVANLRHDGFSALSWEDLKKNVSRMMDAGGDSFEMDMASADLPDYPGIPKEPSFKNILVIDDEVAVNNNIRKILSKEGFHVDQAVTKSEALEKLGNRSYKLVLLDLRIPEVKGLELLAAVRDRNPKAEVIIITGYASIETAVECARMGAFDYLAKPFTPNEIRDMAGKAFRMAA